MASIRKRNNCWEVWVRRKGFLGKHLQKALFIKNSSCVISLSIA